MTRWRRTKTVATFEFLTTVKRRGYLIATFGMPLFMALMRRSSSLPAYFAEAGSKPSVYGVVDPAGVLRLNEEATAGRIRFPRSCGARWRPAASKPR